MRQIQSASKSAMPSHFTYPQKPPYKTAHERPKPKPLGAKQASSLKAHRRSRSQNLARNDALAGANGGIKFNELNRARASALG
ncbi:hypothetical protein [uncultured Campylobacter sp.]|uniref:hypothetical protein n=1 Tax=uncultured Campylobacter sp. TaxID=218934 RepID=UPI00260F92F4|nr:hypothetical protein [uncultured Campylobacter sp.]